MLFRPLILTSIAVLAAAGTTTQKEKKNDIVSIGPRPYFLVDTMEPSFLKDKLGKFETLGRNPAVFLIVQQISDLIECSQMCRHEDCVQDI